MCLVEISRMCAILELTDISQVYYKRNLTVIIVKDCPVSVIILMPKVNNIRRREYLTLYRAV